MRMCGCVRERAYVCVGHVLLQNHSLMWARQRVSEKHRINRDISRQRSDWRGLIACRVFPPVSPRLPRPPSPRATLQATPPPALADINTDLFCV